MKEAAPNFDFADSLYVSCEMKEDFNFVIHIESWDCKELILHFSNTFYFQFERGDDILGLYEKDDDTGLKLLKNVLSTHYCEEQMPQDHPYKVFVLLDIGERTVFEVIAEKVTVTESKETKDNPEVLKRLWRPPSNNKET